MNGRLYWGTDRMFFVERALGVREAAPERLATPPAAGSARLAFFFDYSSPWAYVGFMKLDSLIRNVAPVQVHILFKQGSVMVYSGISYLRDGRKCPR